MSKPVALLLFAAACVSAGALGTRGTATPPGRLVIVGGALSGNNSAVYRAILDGRSGPGPLCVFPTAGATPDSAMASPVATFDRHGGPGTAVGVLVSSQKPATAHDPAVVAQIRTCSGVWFIGGVQSRVIAAFQPQGKSTPAYEALMQRWREGAVVAGSSAGAAIMSDPMIAGGTSQAAMARGVRRITSIGADADDSSGGVTLSPGLGFFNAALADQHFLARGRFGRLLTAMLELNEVDLGFGIDENTALVVDRDSLQVIGTSGVVVLDERGARRSGKSVTDVKVHLLGDSVRFDLLARTPSVNPTKTKVIQANGPIDTVATAFARFEFLKALDRFSQSASARLVMRYDGGAIVLRKEPGFAAFRSSGTGVQDTPRGLGMAGVRLDIIRD